MMSNKYKRLFMLCGIFVVLTACNESNAQTEYEKNVAALEKTCADLTANDSDDHVYEPIVGRYLGSKSTTMMVPSVSRWLSHNMVFSTRTENINVYSRAEDKDIKEYFSLLDRVLGEGVVQDKVDTKNKYGICAYKGNKGAYIGIIETLKGM